MDADTVDGERRLHVLSSGSFLYSPINGVHCDVQNVSDHPVLLTGFELRGTVGTTTRVLCSKHSLTVESSVQDVIHDWRRFVEVHRCANEFVISRTADSLLRLDTPVPLAPGERRWLYVHTMLPRCSPLRSHDTVGFVYRRTRTKQIGDDHLLVRRSSANSGLPFELYRLKDGTRLIERISYVGSTLLCGSVMYKRIRCARLA